MTLDKLPFEKEIILKHINKAKNNYLAINKLITEQTEKIKNKIQSTLNNDNKSLTNINDGNIDPYNLPPVKSSDGLDLKYLASISLDNWARVVESLIICPLKEFGFDTYKIVEEYQNSKYSMIDKKAYQEITNNFIEALKDTIGDGTIALESIGCNGMDKDLTSLFYIRFVKYLNNGQYLLFTLEVPNFKNLDHSNFYHNAHKGELVLHCLHNLKASEICNTYDIDELRSKYCEFIRNAEEENGF